MEALLRSWGLDEFIPNFEANKITVENLRDLDIANDLPIYLEKLVGGLVGPQIKFKKNLIAWRATKEVKDPLAQADDNSSFNDSTNLQDIDDFVLIEENVPVHLISEAVLHNFTEKHDDTFSVKHMLESVPNGQLVLSAYKESGKLDSTLRKRLCEVISTGLIRVLQEKKIKITNEILEKCSREIVNLFPSEYKTTYFVNPREENENQVISKGKLVDKFRNSVRDLRQAGVLPMERKGRKRKQVPEAEGVINDSVLECKRRLRNDKDTYDRRLGDNKSDSGASPSKIAKKSPLEKQQSFLHTTNFIQRRCSNTDEYIEVSGNEEQDEEHGVGFHGATIKQEAPEDIVSVASPKPMHQIQIETSANRVDDIAFRDEICLAIEKRSEEHGPIVKEPINKCEEDDDVTLFFKSIAKSVQKMPRELQIRAKLETLTLISNIERNT